jgi:hypothetical protein
VAGRKKAKSLAEDLADTLAAAAIQARVTMAGKLSFRAFLESQDFCGLQLSPVIAAIADASEGIRLATIAPELCVKVFGCEPDAMPTVARRVVAVSAGGRGGKTSRLLAPKALHGAWTVPLRLPGAPIDPAHPNAQEVGKGEHVAAIVVAPKRRLAKQCFSFIRGYVESSPLLLAAVVGEITGESLTLRRPDGIFVDVQVVVADKGGASMRSKTLVFAGIDEASFLSGAGAAVNDEDIRSAAIQRIVPGGQLYIVSTPWIAEEGVLEQLVTTDFGRHLNALVAARVGTRLLNPTWDPDGSIERAERARPGGSTNADREILAIPLAKGSRCYFPADAIARALILTAPDSQAEEVGAGVDLGLSAGGDHSALSIASRYPGGIFTALVALEIAGGNGQKGSDTYKAFARRLLDHGCASVAADVHYKEAFIETLDHHGIQFIDAASKDRVYAGTKTLLVEGRLALGGLDAVTREAIADQLASIVATPMSAGRVKITAPRRRVADMGVGATMGGHCDSVSALTLSLWRCGSLDPQTWVVREVVNYLDDFDDAPDSGRGGGIDRDDLRWRD